MTPPRSRRKATATATATATKSDAPNAFLEAPARITKFRAFGEELVVLSLPLSSSRVPSELTESEQHVFRLLVDGATNREVAASRGTALRTVANQVASIFRKLGVRSRAELLVAYAVGP